VREREGEGEVINRYILYTHTRKSGNGFILLFLCKNKTKKKGKSKTRKIKKNTKKKFKKGVFFCNGFFFFYLFVCFYYNL
jgi:hypothetical protein